MEDSAGEDRDASPWANEARPLQLTPKGRVSGGRGRVMAIGAGVVALGVAAAAAVGVALLAVLGIAVALWWPLTLPDGQPIDQALMEWVAPGDVAPSEVEAELVTMPDPAKGDDKIDDEGSDAKLVVMPDPAKGGTGEGEGKGKIDEPPAAP